jgi:hypothetical protein
VALSQVPPHRAATPKPEPKFTKLLLITLLPLASAALGAIPRLMSIKAMLIGFALNILIPPFLQLIEKDRTGWPAIPAPNQAHQVNLFSRALHLL